MLDTHTLSRKDYCELPFIQMLIERNGDVRACCYNEEILGNIADNSVKDIWHGDLFSKLRQSIKEGRYDFGCRQNNCPILAELERVKKCQ